MTRRRELEVDLYEARERALTAELALERAGHRLDVELERGDRLEAELREVRIDLAKLEAERSSGWPTLERRRIIVNTTNGEGFEGILWATGSAFILRDAKLLGADGQALPSPQPIDGEVIIDYARVAWVQAPAAVEG